MLSSCFHIVIHLPFVRYEGQRDMLYNQTFNLDQVQFAAEGIKDAQQTVCIQELSFFFFFFVIFALNSFICMISLFFKEYEHGLIHNRSLNINFSCLPSQVIYSITSFLPLC